MKYVFNRNLISFRLHMYTVFSETGKKTYIPNCLTQCYLNNHQFQGSLSVKHFLLTTPLFRLRYQYLITLRKYTHAIDLVFLSRIFVDNTCNMRKMLFNKISNHVKNNYIYLTNRLSYLRFRITFFFTMRLF